MHSEKEIRTKLARKEYNKLIIDKVVMKCMEYGYVDDEAFARAFISGKRAFKNEGIQKLKQQLYNKGISSDMIESLLHEFVNDDDEYEKAKIAGIKKYKQLSNESKYKQKEKLFRHLVGKGFSFDTISKAIQDITEGGKS